MLAVILFWAVGFGVMFGQTHHGWFGWSHFFIEVNDPWMIAFFVFQSVFVGTSATIDSGAVAGRTKFRAYLITSACISGLIYPVFGHWAWGGLLDASQQGWLEAKGFIDFAGSTVVHSVGGWMALVGVIVVGPRMEKFDRNGQPRHIAPHNMTMAYLGTFILFFGWFGFNCGSTLEASNDVAKIALNTMLAGCFGCLSASTLSWVRSPFHRPEGEMIANGILGGLVGITAGCASVGSMGASAIGLVSGVVVYYGTMVIERVFKLDDVVGAISVHGLCGAWGTIAVGIFILPENLGETTRLAQIGVQALGVGTCFVWTFAIGYLIIKLIDKFGGGLRVDPEDEMVGLNVAEHGASSSILDLAQAMQKVVATGDYDHTKDVAIEIGTEAGDLARFFNKMIGALRQEKHRSDFQMEEFGTYMRENVDRIGQESEAMTGLLKETADQAGDMVEAIREAVGGIDNLVQALVKASEEASLASRESGKNIAQVVATISKIAMQTEILALNASVEAARAGEAGAGFAVVADSVRELAGRTNQSTEKIDQQVGRMHQASSMVADEVTEQAKRSQELARTVEEAVSQADKMMEGIALIDSKAQAVSQAVKEAYDRFTEFVNRVGRKGLQSI